MESKGLALNVPQTGSGIMMDAHKPVKKPQPTCQQSSQGDRRPVQAITDSARLQPASTVCKRIPQGFYRAKVRMSAGSSQAGPTNTGFCVFSPHSSLF